MKNTNKKAMDDMQVAQVSGGTLPRTATMERQGKMMKVKPTHTGNTPADDQMDRYPVV